MGLQLLLVVAYPRWRSHHGHRAEGVLRNVLRGSRREWAKASAGQVRGRAWAPDYYDLRAPLLCGVAFDENADALVARLAAADLRDVCEGSLPPGLDRRHDLRLDGAHLVQLLQAVDISQPLNSAEDAGPDEGAGGPGLQGAGEGTGSRRGPCLLKVCLVDGAGQVVCGIERRPIAALRNATPGAKMVLGGAPWLRRGLLLLEPSNLELLGTAPAMHAMSSTDPAAPSGPSRSTAPNQTVPVGDAAAVAGYHPHGVTFPSSNSGLHTPQPAAVTVAPSIAHEPAFARPASISSTGMLPGSVLGAGSPEQHAAASRAFVERTPLATEALAQTALAADVSRTWVQEGIPPATAAATNLHESAGPSHSPATTAPGISSASTRFLPSDGLLEVNQRFYVYDAQLFAGGLSVQLCDGIGQCGARIQLPLALQLFPCAPRETWPARARMLHGFFHLRWDADLDGGIFVVEAFGKSPASGDVKRQLHDLLSVAGGNAARADATAGFVTTAACGSVELVSVADAGA